MAKIKHTRNENGQHFTHQIKTTLFWRKKAKINLHQNFPIYSIPVSSNDGINLLVFAWWFQQWSIFVLLLGPLVRTVVSRPSSTVGQCKPCGDKRCKCCLQLQHAQVFHNDLPCTHDLIFNFFIFFTQNYTIYINDNFDIYCYG